MIACDECEYLSFGPLGFLVCERCEKSFPNGYQMAEFAKNCEKVSREEVEKNVVDEFSTM